VLGVIGMDAEFAGDQFTEWDDFSLAEETRHDR
jgi:hypothetical protein